MTFGRATFAWFGLAATQLSAQVFVVDNSGLPQLLHPSEAVDLGDIDLDGDLDVYLADGGEGIATYDRLWSNQGGLQGGSTGIFADESSARLPAGNTPAMDVSLIDIDGDGDLDAHVTTTDFGLAPFSARWIVNVGGAQGGALGYFVDETAQRWLGLAQAGSTVTPSMLVAQGGFTDASYAAVFGDLDADGDLDVVHTTYKPSRPTRIFLNDGNGRFSEHNPAGTVLSGPSGLLLEGSTALWCEGLQKSETVDASGAFCDVLWGATDVDLLDFDGDLDLDLLPSDWYSSQQRLFANRLEASALAPGAGTLLFRDVTLLAMPPAAPASPIVAAEPCDLDGDGDLDLYGANWAASDPPYDDLVFENAAGVLVPHAIPAGSSAGDFDTVALDFDADGNLDMVAVSDWENRIYRGLGGLELILQPSVGPPHPSNEGAVGDIDGDGDDDMLFARNGAEDLWVNVTQAQDVFAPWFPVVEDLAGAVAAPGSRQVRAHVLDNASWTQTRFADVRVELAVDGIALPDAPARWAGGQLFRAELPANLAGQVSWRFRATDAHGNTGVSTWKAFPSSAPAFQAPYGAATAGLSGGAPTLSAKSVPFAKSTLHLALSSAASPGTPALIGVGSQALDPGVPLPGLFLLQVGGLLLGSKSTSLDANGDALLSAPLGAIPAGATVYAQGFVLDTTASGDAFASSNGLVVTTQ